jgi:threonine/homoserine/homoserine lactone efflux protein
MERARNSAARRDSPWNDACSRAGRSALLLPFLLGLGIAFVGSMPMSGPVAVVVLSRALRRERGSALLVALGAALVEAVIAGVIAAFLPHLLGKARGVVLASLGIGSLVVTTLGVLLVVRPRTAALVADASPRRGLLHGALSSLLNPTLIATWTVVVSTLYANDWLSPLPRYALTFALGVGLGSMAWFGLAVLAIGASHRNVTPRLQERVLRAMGGLLMISGIALGVRFANALSSPTVPAPPKSIERAGHYLTHGSSSNEQ